MPKTLVSILFFLLSVVVLAGGLVHQAAAQPTEPLVDPTSDTPPIASLPVVKAGYPVIDIAHIIQTIFTTIQRAQQIAYQVQNLAAIASGDFNWRDALLLLFELADVVGYGESLVYSIDDLEEKWFETFQAFELLDPEVYPEGADQLGRQRLRRTLDTLWGGMRTVETHARRLEDSQRLLDNIKRQAQAAGGNLESLQANNMLAGYAAEETAQLRQLVTTALNMFLVVEADRLAGQAQTAEELQAWIGDDLLPVGTFGSVPR